MRPSHARPAAAAAFAAAAAAAPVAAVVVQFAAAAAHDAAAPSGSRSICLVGGPVHCINNSIDSPLYPHPVAA